MLTDVSPDVIEQFKLIASLALYLSPIVIAVTEMVKRSFPEHVEGVVTIGVALIVGLLTGIVIPSAGIGVGIFAAIYGIAGTAIAKKFGEQKVVVTTNYNDSTPEPTTKVFKRAARSVRRIK